MEKGAPQDHTSLKTECNQNIITEIADKIKLGLSLPKLLANDGALLKPSTSPSDLRYMQTKWKKRLLTNKLQTLAVHNEPNFKSNKTLFVTRGIQQCQLYYSSEHLEEILKLCSKTFTILQNQGLVSYCDENLQEMISDAGAKFLQTFEKLGNIPFKKTGHSSTILRDDKEKENELSELSEKARQELAQLQINFQDQKIQCEQLLEEKQKMIEAYKMKLDAVKQNVSKNIGKIIERSEEKITLGIQSSKKRQENMLKTLTANEEKLTSLQEFNRFKEEALHVIRKSAEAELKFLINKYDEDMNCKQCELEDLVMKYEMEKNMYIELKRNFEVQNETYMKLMAEKAEYERALWDQRLLEVRQKFAARKIQRCVRNYLAKLKTRGKKYGGRKKVKKGAKK